MKNRLLATVCLSLCLGGPNVPALTTPPLTSALTVSVAQDKAESVPEEKKKRALALLKRAEELVQAESDPILKSVALMSVARGYQVAQDTEKVRALLATAAQLLSGPEELSEEAPKSDLLTLPVAEMQAKNGDAEGWAFLEQQVAKANGSGNLSLQALKLGGLGARFYRAGRQERGLELLAQAVQYASGEPDDFGIRRGRLEGLANIYAALGQRDKAVEVVLLIESQEGDISGVWEDIVIAYAKAGEIERSRELSRKITAQSCRIGPQLAIAKAYLDSGATEQAAALLKPLIPQAKPDATYYQNFDHAEFVSFLLRAGLKQEALRILRENKDNRIIRFHLAIILAESNPDLAEKLLQEAYLLLQADIGTGPFRIAEWNRIALTYIQLGRKEKAVEILTQAQQATLAVKDGFVRDGLLPDIAFSYTLLDQDETAIELIEAIEHPIARARALARLAGIMLMPPETITQRLRQRKGRLSDEL